MQGMVCCQLFSDKTRVTKCKEKQILSCRTLSSVTRAKTNKWNKSHSSKQLVITFRRSRPLYEETCRSQYVGVMFLDSWHEMLPTAIKNSRNVSNWAASNGTTRCQRWCFIANIRTLLLPIKFKNRLLQQINSECMGRYQQ